MDKFEKHAQLYELSVQSSSNASGENDGAGKTE